MSDQTRSEDAPRAGESRLERLFLVRHGQSEHHVRDVTGGWTDVGLTELGHIQAQRVAEHLALAVGGEPVSLFSSDLARAAATADAIGRRLGVACTLDAGLRELDNGRAAGLTRAEAKAIELPRTEPVIDWVPYPGAETWRQMTERVAACMDRLARTSEPIAIVVCHAGTASAIVKWWLRLPSPALYGVHFEFRVGSVSELGQNEWGERVLVRLNDVSML